MAGAGTARQVAKKLGMAFLFQPDPVTIAGTTTPFPWVDMGGLKERSLKNDGGKVTVYDDRDGKKVPVHVVETASNPSYDLTIENVSGALLAMYYRGLPPVAWTQSSSTATDIPHKAWPDAPVKIMDNSTIPVPQYMLASITNVKVGATVCVRGVDYDYTPEDLDRGVIYILPTSTNITAANTSITITYGLAAVAGGLVIYPQSGGCSIEGYGQIHMGGCGGQSRIVEEGRFSVTFPELGVPIDDIANMKVTVDKLTDSGSNNPSGRVLLTKGQW